MTGVFKAYDIRGVYPTQLDEGLAYLIGRAYGTWNDGNKIALGWDVRESSPSILEAVRRGLLESGCNVTEIGISTTPMLAWSARFLKCDGGIMITASHNPGEYNGIKFFDRNAMATSYEAGIGKIEEIVNSQNFKFGQGSVSKTNTIEDYSKFLRSHLNFGKAKKIVVDCLNGSAGIMNPKILEDAGFEVIQIRCESNGNFPEGGPDPARKENVEELGRVVLEHKADLGLGFDGDGDRLAIVDERGQEVESKNIFSLLIKNEARNNENVKVVRDTLSSTLIDQTATAAGGTTIECRVGHTYISEKTIQESADLAGELSGHYYFKETFGVDDALFAGLKLLEYLTNSEKEISEEVNLLPKFLSKGLRVSIDEANKGTFIDSAKRALEELNFQTSTMDGVRGESEHGWVLFRLSNTEPKISMGFESGTEHGFSMLEGVVNKILVDNGLNA